MLQWQDIVEDRAAGQEEKRRLIYVVKEGMQTVGASFILSHKQQPGDCPSSC